MIKARVTTLHLVSVLLFSLFLTPSQLLAQHHHNHISVYHAFAADDTNSDYGPHRVKFLFFDASVRLSDYPGVVRQRNSIKFNVFELTEQYESSGPHNESFVGGSLVMSFAFPLYHGYSAELTAEPGVYVWVDSGDSNREDFSNALRFEGDLLIHGNSDGNSGWSAGISYDNDFGTPTLMPVLGYHMKSERREFSFLLSKSLLASWRVHQGSHTTVYAGFHCEVQGENFGALPEAMIPEQQPKFGFSDLSVGPRLEMHTPALATTLDFGVAFGRRRFEIDAGEPIIWSFFGDPVILEFSRTYKLEPSFFLRLTLTETNR